MSIDDRLDRVTVSGDVDLTFDKHGLALAQPLADQIAGIIAAMKAAQARGALPDKFEIVALAPAGNLFGLPDPKVR